MTLSVNQSKQVLAMAEQRQEGSEVSGLAWEMCLLVCMCVCVCVRAWFYQRQSVSVRECVFVHVVCVVTGKYVGFFDHMC